MCVRCKFGEQVRVASLLQWQEQIKLDIEEEKEKQKALEEEKRRRLEHQRKVLKCVFVQGNVATKFTKNTFFRATVFGRPRKQLN